MSIAAPHLSNPWLFLSVGAAFLLRRYIRTALGILVVAAAVRAVRMPEEDRRDAIRAVLAKELAPSPRQENDSGPGTT